MTSVPGTWWVLLAAVAATLVIGFAVRAREGRVRRNTTATTGVDGAVLDWESRELRESRESQDREPWGEGLPEALREHLTETYAFARGGDARVTLLQLSTTFCAPCRHTRILLAGFAERTQGVRHVEIDLTHHPEWSTPLGVHRTPTTIALDSAGRELFRVGGVPRRDDLAEALHPHLDPTT